MIEMLEKLYFIAAWSLILVMMLATTILIMKENDKAKAKEKTEDNTL